MSLKQKIVSRYPTFKTEAITSFDLKNYPKTKKFLYACLIGVLFYFLSCSCTYKFTGSLLEKIFGEISTQKLVFLHTALFVLLVFVIFLWKEQEVAQAPIVVPITPTPAV